MIYQDEEGGIRIDTEYEGASAGELRRTGSCSYEIGTLEDPVPAGFIEQFGNVPFGYTFSIRLRSTANVSRELNVRFLASPHGGEYYGGRAWVERKGHWFYHVGQQEPGEDGDHLDFKVVLESEETILLASMPFMRASEVITETQRVPTLFDFFSCRELGRTAQDRPILALETPARERRIVVFGTPQPAEPAYRPILSLAHALAARTVWAEEVMEQFQFCLIPLPNPDGLAGGHSLTNAIGQVPAGGYGDAAAGRPCPAESLAVWEEIAACPPAAYLEIHTHYRDTRKHCLICTSPEAYNASADRGLIQHFNEVMLEVTKHRTTQTYTRERLVWPHFLNSQVPEHIGSPTYAVQIWTPSEESTNAFLVEFVRAAASALSDT